MAEISFIDLSPTKSRQLVFDATSGRLLTEVTLDAWDSGSLPEGISKPDEAGQTETMVSVPLEHLVIRVLELPLSDPSAIRDILPFELDGLILADTSEMVIDAIVLNETEGNTRVLAACLDKNKLSAILESLGSSGMDPSTVTSIELQVLAERLIGGESLESINGDTENMDDEARLDTARKIVLESPKADFRQGKFKYTRDSDRVLRSIFIAGALCAALVLVISGDLCLKAMQKSKQALAKETQAIALYTDLFPDEKISSAKGLTYKLNAHMQSLKDKDILYRDANPLAFLMKAQSIKREGLVVNELRTGSGAVVFRGTATSIDVLQAFKSDLEGFLTDVTINESGPAASGGTGFIINAKRVAR